MNTLLTLNFTCRDLKPQWRHKIIYWTLVPTIIRILLIFPCHAESNDIPKDTAIREIIYKLCKITMGPMRNAPPHEKEAMFKNLELKLKKATKALNKPDQDHNVRFIMQGVKVMALNNDYKLCAHGLPPILNKTRSTNETTTTTTTENYNSTDVRRRSLVNKDKLTLVMQMVNKLEFLANKAFKNTSTVEDKKIVLNKIKKRVEDALRRRHLDKDEKNNTYSKLIMEALELMMLKNMDPRRMTLEMLANNANAEDDTVFVTTTPAVGLTTEMSCSFQLTEVCTSLKLLNEVKCEYDDTVLGLDKLCDGVIDCPDGSDELYCAKQAVERVHSANDIMGRIDLTRRCFSTVYNNSLISQQSIMLSNLLQTELNFLEKYTTFRKFQGELVKINEYDVRTVTQITNEVFLLLQTFVMALSGAFCVNDKEEFEQMLHRLGESIEKDLDDVTNAPKHYVKRCSCKDQFCMNPSCSSFCKRVCFQKYTLTRWTCRAISGGSSVSLDYLCDGKLDCYDETDESGCIINNSASKFRANIIYLNLLEELKTKTTTYTSVAIRNKLVSLHDAIGTLQKRSMQPIINPTVYKSLRDRSFALLTAVYDLFWSTPEYASRAEDTYEYLLSVNEKLVDVLKKSHTGNKKVIAPDGCFCRGFSCAVPRCTKKCTRTCAAEPYMTNYICSSPKSHGTYIPIEMICNNKRNCPDGEDEKHCKKDFCRAHHLLVLRHHLQKVGEKHEGTVLGEVLKAWKAKVISTLKIAEKRERPTQRDFKQIVASILHDLVKTYSLLDDYGRTNNDTVLKKFEKLAQRILETLKSCGM